jgi:hypothetical protein
MCLIFQLVLGPFITHFNGEAAVSHCSFRNFYSSAQIHLIDLVPTDKEIFFVMFVNHSLI